MAKSSCAGRFAADRPVNSVPSALSRPAQGKQYDRTTQTGSRLRGNAGRRPRISSTCSKSAQPVAASGIVIGSKMVDSEVGMIPAACAVEPGTAGEKPADTRSERILAGYRATGVRSPRLGGVRVCTMLAAGLPIDCATRPKSLRCLRNFQNSRLILGVNVHRFSRPRDRIAYVRDRAPTAPPFDGFAKGHCY